MSNSTSLAAPHTPFYLCWCRVFTQVSRDCHLYPACWLFQYQCKMAFWYFYPLWFLMLRLLYQKSFRRKPGVFENTARAVVCARVLHLGWALRVPAPVASVVCVSVPSTPNSTPHPPKSRVCANQVPLPSACLACFSPIPLLLAPRAPVLVCLTASSVRALSLSLFICFACVDAHPSIFPKHSVFSSSPWFGLLRSAPP